MERPWEFSAACALSLSTRWLPKKPLAPLQSESDLERYKEALEDYFARYRGKLRESNYFDSQAA